VDSKAPKIDQRLSPREAQALDLLSSGYRYKEIADELSISITTVKFHVKNICEKMHVRNHAEAIAKLCSADPGSD
jgi:DNA-binding CsgD family transcriptional regulator